MNHYRLHQRIGDYKTLGIGRLPKHKLVFNKCGGDNSGKCTVIPSENHNVWGVVCEISFKQKEKLDYFEGIGHGYDAVINNVVMENCSIEAVFYQAQLNAMDDGLAPFDWYKDFVLTGAKYHRLPDEYIKIIDSVVAIPDQDRAREQLNRNILNGIYPC